MVSRMVHVSFNFDTDTASVSGITEDPISKKISVSTDPNCDFSCFELDQTILSNISYTPKYYKWVFSWKQYHKKEQFLSLEQYVPFPTSYSIFHPKNYNPWYTIASFSYIASPSKGTIQTNQIRRTINDRFNKNLMVEI